MSSVTESVVRDAPFTVTLSSLLPYGNSAVPQTVVSSIPFVSLAVNFTAKLVFVPPSFIAL